MKCIQNNLPGPKPTSIERNSLSHSPTTALPIKKPRPFHTRENKCIQGGNVTSFKYDWNSFQCIYDKIVGAPILYESQPSCMDVTMRHKKQFYVPIDWLVKVDPGSLKWRIIIPIYLGSLIPCIPQTTDFFSLRTWAIQKQDTHDASSVLDKCPIFGSSLVGINAVWRVWMHRHHHHRHHHHHDHHPS